MVVNALDRWAREECMIRQAFIAGVALALIGGCKVRDENRELDEVDEVQIAPGTPSGDEQPYIPQDDLAGDRWDGADRPDRRADERAPARDDDADRGTRDRTAGRVASRQDLQRAIEDAGVKIERLRASQDLTDAEEADLEGLERRIREVKADLDDVKRDADTDWDAVSDQLRTRLKRINRAIEKVEDNEA
jgi:hypothetical protein